MPANSTPVLTSCASTRKAPVATVTICRLFWIAFDSASTARARKLAMSHNSVASLCDRRQRRNRAGSMPIASITSACLIVMVSPAAPRARRAGSASRCAVQRAGHSTAQPACSSAIPRAVCWASCPPDGLAGSWSQTQGVGAARGQRGVMGHHHKGRALVFGEFEQHVDQVPRGLMAQECFQIFGGWFRHGGRSWRFSAKACPGSSPRTNPASSRSARPFCRRGSSRRRHRPR
mgnify:CR=1 FL=1